MEALVLTATAVLSVAIPVLGARGRAFFVLFLHLLVLLTVGSLAIRTLNGGGTLLVPFVEGWSPSPLMQLTNVKVYTMLAISAIAVTSVVAVKGRIIWALPDVLHQPHHPIAESPFSCLAIIWLHVAMIVALALI